MKYSLSLREIPRAKLEGVPEGSDFISLCIQTQIAIQTFSILVELILRIAPTAGQYGKIMPRRLSNTGELNWNIRMFSN